MTKNKEEKQIIKGTSTEPQILSITHNKETQYPVQQSKYS